MVSLGELGPYERQQVRYRGRLSRLLPVSCLSFARELQDKSFREFQTDEITTMDPALQVRDVSFWVIISSRNLVLQPPATSCTECQT
jgi:hypothetical protein